MAQHWSAHGIIVVTVAAVAVYAWVAARTPRDRYGVQAFIAAAAILACGTTYMAGV